MGISSVKGSFGIGLQTTKGTAAASINYLQATAVNIQPDQGSAALGPEVGGAMWSRESYKTGVAVFGDVSFVPRANTLGWLLRAFAGTATAAGSEGVYNHTFKEATDVSSIPYCTLVKNVSDVWAEQYKDCRVDSLRLDLAAAGVMTAAMGFVGITPSEVAVPSETWDDSPIFECNTGQVAFAGATTNKVTRLSLDFANNLTRDERVVGSYYLNDMTLIRRACRITCDTFLTDATWYRDIYNNGTSAWDPTIKSVELDAYVDSAKHFTGTTHARFRVVIPNMDYLVMPVALVGNDVIRCTMTAELTLSGSSLPFYMELRCGEDDFALS